MSDAPRLTVAAIVERDARFLFVEEYVGGQSVLNQPAGHVDPGESVLHSVSRETLEETACTVRPLALVGIYQLLLGHVHYVRLAFHCEYLSFDPKLELDEPILRTHWLNRDELVGSLIPHRSSLVLRSLDDHLAGRSYPLEMIGEATR
jgi:8-oxo-dGTP pyrophosphatase MutT (NUDIX family)